MNSSHRIIAIGLLSMCAFSGGMLHSDEANVQDVADSGPSSFETSLASYEQRMQEFENQLAGFHTQSCPSEEKPCGCECSGCCPGWFISADYLNWQIERNDLAFAILDPAGLGVPAAGQPILQLDLGPSNGIRASVGRRTTQGWEVGFSYTYLSATDNRIFAPGGGQVLAVLSSPATGLTNADSVSAASEFKYQVFDLEAGHWIDMSDSLSMYVFGGARYSTIDHRLQAVYDGGAFINGVVDVPTSLEAIGGRLGCAMHWNVVTGVSLFGRGAVSLNASDIDARRQEINAGAVVIDASRSTHPLIPALDLALGVRASFDGWSIAGGYELTNWFNAVSPLEFTDSFNGGTLAAVQRDLGLHGLFFNATYSF